MALPMLVGGAECGSSNPLQTLTKRFDQDKGLQQDFFGVNRAGSSREAFRSLPAAASASNQEATNFFAVASGPAIQAATVPSFDLSPLRDSLPATHFSTYSPHNSISNWTADFAQSQQLPAAGASLVGLTSTVTPGDQLQYSMLVPTGQHHAGSGSRTQGRLQWNPAMAGFRMNPASAHVHHAHMPPQAQMKQPQIDQTSWDREFTSQATNIEGVEQHVQQPSDELARTAAMLLDQVKHEQNPKFKSSQFMDLMRQLRDGKVTVEGDQMVETGGKVASQVDVKGKGRAVDNISVSKPSFLPTQPSQMAPLIKISSESLRENASWMEDVNDAYFRQENEDYIRYWAEQDAPPESASIPPLIESDWDKLQADWDQFEATATGIRKVDFYQFQVNNPYMLGDSSRLQTAQDHGYQSTAESVMELEASVQRDMNNVMAWYHLGVKQQENEREHKALQALNRAVELDPSHLPSWLALSISHTNDGNRGGAYDAISEWVDRNEKYKTAVLPARSQINENVDAPLVQRYEDLINCLISMARSNADGEIDADIQIALAVLLNANEEYGKAQDCFRTALALQPDDWLLYNRVGATMANNGHAEDALQYYYKALELNPGYIRARYNLGISCINLVRYEEAAQHILDALVLQENDGTSGLNKGVTSSALWDSLKTTCLHMRRVDLATLCDRRNLDGFRSSFQTS